MGIICLYVLIQKSGQKTAKSHLCALERIATNLKFRPEFYRIQPASSKGRQTSTIWSGIYSVLGSCKQFLEVVRHSVIGQ